MRPCSPAVPVEWAGILAVIMNTHQPKKSWAKRLPVPSSRHFTGTDGLQTEAQGPQTREVLTAQGRPEVLGRLFWALALVN